LPFAFKPAAIGVEWSGLQVAPNALFERKQRIPEAVVMKCSVGCEHSAGFFDRITQKFSPSGMLFVWHSRFPLLLLFSSVVFRLEKNSNAPPECSLAPNHPRCQGRLVFAFTGAQRTPLTGEAGG
jgi:hypothetical protein